MYINIILLKRQNLFQTPYLQEMAVMSYLQDTYLDTKSFLKRSRVSRSRGSGLAALLLAEDPDRLLLRAAPPAPRPRSRARSAPRRSSCAAPRPARGRSAG